MRYFAMIDGERRGPFELDQLPDAGVGPDTYVWCKGMDDWEKAADVADICRFYRQRLFNLAHPQHEPATAVPKIDQLQERHPVDPVNPRFLRPGDMEYDPADPIDPSLPPSSSNLIVAILLTLFCFPFTGLVAIYYSFMARKAWMEAGKSNSAQKKLYTDAEREECRKQAHAYDRNARMWIGITFFLGIILYAFLGRKIF